MSLICLALVWLGGFCLLRSLFPAPLRWSVHNLLLLSMGAGAGIGIASSLYFLCLALTGPKLPVLVSVEAAALLAVIALAMRAKPREPVFDWAPSPLTPWYLTGLFLLAAAAATTIFFVYAINKPHGEWDAWSIWNLRARFLFRAGEFWRDAFSNQIAWSHPDYPLLVPGIVAMCWTLAGSESTTAQIAVGFLFAVSAAGTLVAALGILRGRSQAFVAGALLLGTVLFVELGAMQYADLPLSSFILASLALLALQDRYRNSARLSAMAGVAAGFAAWTKNEGLLFVAALIAARVIAILRYGKSAELRRGLGALAAGLVAPLAVVAFFKLRFAPPGDLLSKKPGEVLAHAADPGRWLTVLEGFIKAALLLGNFLLPVLLALALYWYLVRFRVEQRDRALVATGGIAVTLMLLGDFVIYVLFSNDVVWQINASIDRIYLQVWPSALFVFFLAANVPQLVRERPSAEKSKPAKRAHKAARR